MRNNLAKISYIFGCFLLLSLTYPYNDFYTSNGGSNNSYNYVKDVFTVVIDAGHGGKDGGTSGLKSREKNIALSIALKLGKEIEKNNPDVKVIYTRKDDTFIPLFERVKMANEAQADLFLSIHCNASSRKAAKGTETFVMGLHKAEENLETAKRENSAILMEADFEENYDGYDPNSDVGHIILSMYQNVYLDQSIEFASMIEDQFGVKTSRGVKQAGFVVLRRATMPAVLIETGFLSNPEDEKRLLSNSGQEKITKALYKAFVNYKNQKAESIQPQDEPAIAVSEKDKDQGKEFRIQVAAKKEVKAELFPNVEGLEILKDGDLYKYVTRPYPSMTEARKIKEKLKNQGYKEAFIVVYPKERVRNRQK
jgi:N-acetylmuramoyl-L-alanine amidase